MEVWWVNKWQKIVEQWWVNTIQGDGMIIYSAILTQNGIVSKKIDLRFQCQRLLLAKNN
jgi:hypothetical protein